MSAVTVLPGPERRRRWTSSEKARILEESLTADASVAEVARRHDVHPNLLHAWRRQARLGGVVMARQRRDAPAAGGVEFAAVALAPAERILPPPPGVIEFEFANGARVKITGPVDPSMTAALIKALAQIARRR
jgi:transposase